ncbi:MAG: hypothetical protein HOO96_04530 [Polyangiaceae bacterium]|nr:hypothetical protein [Polyangiaceae bacterium]
MPRVPARKAPLYQRLMARHPLPPKDAKAALPDLGSLAAAYARCASYHGAKGPYWRVWRAIERARGHRLRASVATLEPSARRWFALWSFAQGRVREGVRVYRAYIADPGKMRLLDAENATYLRHVAARATPAQVLAEADAIRAKAPESSRIETVVLEALLTLGDAAASRLRYPRPEGATIHVGASWARHAIVEKRWGDPAAATRALAMCAKLGTREGYGDSGALTDLLLETFGLEKDAWAAMCRPWAYPEGDLAAAFLASPGATVIAGGPSAHSFGSRRFAMPACPGCAGTMHVFFELAVPEVPDLAARIPGWPWLPLVGCLDCCLWLVRRDFRVDHAAARLELLAVAATPSTIASLGKRIGQLAPITPQPAALGPHSGVAGMDCPQIGGEPDWVQDFERAFCPLCAEEMRFVAALGSTRRCGFEPEITINNGSGYQYHFACNACSVLSVVGQNT